ncbi:hypothetical protein NE237_022503 [Protea cynaroides]|uniref:Uncharacterized protein n=1 Tax=Protea cynaroides TaxID=273540 RepID=A0A9Q0HB56_9MAGN|nr:hypothetical protein NE237_022503 [Protea cynaroides]
MSYLEQQRASIEERKQILKKTEKEELRAQRELSMYASVTKIIPDLADQIQVCGHIVDRDKKMVEKFEFDPTKASSLEICNGLWKMIILFVGATLWLGYNMPTSGDQRRKIITSRKDILGVQSFCWWQHLVHGAKSRDNKSHVACKSMRMAHNLAVTIVV